MYLLEVKHHQNDPKSYWFEVPERIAHLIKEGDEVLCETVLGKVNGFAQADPTHITSNAGHIIKAMGLHLPLAPIIGVYNNIALDEIKIREPMRYTIPASEKIAARVEELKSSGKFRTKIVIDRDGVLLDGYTAYLVAKMFGQSSLRVCMLDK